MKLKHLLVLSLTAGAALSTNAMAADPTVTFKGEVLGSTCTPSIDNGQTSTVTLLPIIPSMFPAVNDTAGEKTFTINLTGCGDTGGKKVKAYFYQTGAHEGRLSKTTGTGNGWTYQLLPASGTATLTVGNNGTAVITDPNDDGATITSGSGTITYRVRYHRDAITLTNGTLDALANYVLYTN